MADRLLDILKERLPSTFVGYSLIPLESILCTEELRRRASRPPDHETENRALSALVQALAESPRTILQTLADTILEIFKCDSAGMSLLTEDEKHFQWAAVAGAWQPHLGGGTPRNFGPCGDVLDRNTPLLFKHWERRYPYLMEATPLAEEGLLVPFHVSGKAVGTIWAITHDDRRQFDAEDLRQLECLARFVSAAYLAATSLESKDQRRVALTLMEDALESRRAVEALNVQLRDSEKRLHDMIDALPVAVYTTDAEGRVTQFNAAAIALAGRVPQLGQDEWCVTWKLFRLDGTPLPHSECPMALTLKEDRDVPSEQLIAERPDGTRRCVEVFPTRLRNAEGRTTGGVNMIVDITERKQAEMKLRESEELFRTLFESAPMAVFVCDRDAVIQNYNRRAMELWGREPVCGKEKHCGSVGLWLPNGELLPHGQSPVMEVLRTGVPVFNVEVFIERPDGSRVPVLVNFAALKDAKGEIAGAVTSFVDITERKQAEGALIKSEKLSAAGRLAAGLAHEINNPLQAVSNLMELLRRSTKIGAEDRAYADMAADELRRVTHLTRQSLSFYRETDSPVAIDLEEVLAGILSLYAKQIAAKKIAVSTQYEAGGTRIDSYPGAVRQVLSTLLHNALEAVQETGAIAIRVRKCFHEARGAAVPRIRITMADDGAGIAPENLSRIFEPFFTTKGERGTGLGLWVAQGIVSGLGGTIRVRSSMRPGKSGTCFSIFLPNQAPKKVHQRDSSGLSHRQTDGQSPLRLFGA